MGNHDELRNEIVDGVMKALDDVDLDEVAGGFLSDYKRYKKQAKLDDAYKNLQDGKINQQQYDAIVDKIYGIHLSKPKHPGDHPQFPPKPTNTPKA